MIDLRTPDLGLLRSLALSIIDSQRPACSLRQEVAEMTKILADSGTIRIVRQEDISRDETLTSNGLALSPTMAVMCADDFVRTIEFIRATHAAIVDIRKQYPDRPARVLYAGCGPYATLAVPLMAVLSPKQVTFTLLDIHSGSIESVKSIVAALGLAGFVADCEAMDAGSYRINPDRTPDVILIEIMQACLESEPQVAVARHLAPQAPKAILIPEEVRIDLVLVDPSCEFDFDGLQRNGGDIQRDRIPVAPVFVLNRDTITSWNGLCTDRLPGSAARIPDFMEQRYQPMLFTTVRVYQDHVLKDYDSGLTYPRVFSNKVAIRAGDTIQFHYELGRQPRLSGEVCDKGTLLT